MQMKLGKLLAETKTGEKRQIEPEKFFCKRYGKKNRRK